MSARYATGSVFVGGRASVNLSILARLIKVYNSLPPEAQQIFVEKHLAGLLDAVSKDKSKKGENAGTITGCQ